MNAEANKAFVEHLKREFDLVSSDIPRLGVWAGSGNTLGAIGLRVGILSLDHIDQIISMQSYDNRLFGQIAIALKFLTDEQVDRLLTMQRFYRCLDLGVMLVFENRMSFSDLLASMARHFESSSAPAR